MHIYGAYPSQQVLQWHQPEQHFFVHGRADDASEMVENARIVLAPIRFGAGIKGKLLEAMACGTPSVTTMVGAEAMHGDLPWNGFIRDNPSEMAEAAVHLYQDKTAWLAAQENGRTIINTRFLKSGHAENFLKRILSVQGDLDQHRANNFTGAMLLHHTMKSTEYMSRWIEAKNKH